MTGWDPEWSCKIKNVSTQTHTHTHKQTYTYTFDDEDDYICNNHVRYNKMKKGKKERNNKP